LEKTKVNPSIAEGLFLYTYGRQEAKSNRICGRVQFLLWIEVERLEKILLVGYGQVCQETFKAASGIGRNQLFFRKTQ
jgi:hypothetical protein